ncbi:unnamed protein product [Schistosoma margrebowiei]|uniref:Aquaporin-9 n=1 Tax=Schistosoma margrebowiei TaxID=48269 RepID=A0AA85AP25_9TREM|nr:unnamed protein product [Schistosoma margrebowiei]
MSKTIKVEYTIIIINNIITITGVIMSNNNESIYQIRYNAFIKQLTNYINLTKWPLLCNCINEFIGTTIFIIFGLGVMIQTNIHSINNKNIGQYLSISTGWGIAKIIGLLISTNGCGGSGGGCSGDGDNGGDHDHHSSSISNHGNQSGLLNPSITFAYCLIVQLLGSIFGTFIILCIYWENIQLYAKLYSYGKLEMNYTGSLFVNLPNVSHQLCLLDYIISNTIYSWIILIINNNHNLSYELQLIYIGLLFTGIIGSLSLNIGIGLNPANDLGARITISLCGWGIQAFKANNYYFWLPLIGPYIGAIIGSLFYGFIISLHIIPLSDIDQYKIQNNQCTIINSSSNYLQSSFIEEMNEDLFNITEIDDCFIDSEETLD